MHEELMELLIHYNTPLLSSQELTVFSRRGHASPLFTLPFSEKKNEINDAK